MSTLTNFDEIMERLASHRLWDFPGGVHPNDQKGLSNYSPISRLSIPKKLYIPVKQHIGVDADLIINVGDKVLTGQPLTESHNPFAVPVHASSSGEILEITKHVSSHPSGLDELTVVIETDGLDTPFARTPISDYASSDRSSIIEAICKAGISGMGGAGFPTHVKSNNVKPIEFLIINGVECEPYITADDRLMREHAWQIRQGIDILDHILQPRQVLIAIEDNKPEAIQTMSIACQQKQKYQVIKVPTKYPAGGEKQLIQVLTSREVPSDGLPVDVGCLMYNVGTCYAIADAITEGKALTERVVTVTGKALQQPQNYWVRLGTPVRDCLFAAGYDANKQLYPQIIMGGPMMGFTLKSSQSPIIKTTNCLLVPAKNELPVLEDERACIRCSACADACPVSLLPQQLFWYSKSKDYEVAEDYNLFDCIECGACAYVCPSEIPLVHYYRIAKAEIRQQKLDKEKSEKARQRFENRKTRLAQEKKAREEKHRQAALARQKATAKGETKDIDAKDKVAAALARAKARKAAQQSSETSLIENSTSTTHSNENTPSQDKNAKVAAALERAKARKQQLSASQGSTESRNGQEHSDKVAAAIARAKARKAAQSTSTEQKPQDNDE